MVKHAIIIICLMIITQLPPKASSHQLQQPCDLTTTAKTQFWARNQGKNSTQPLNLILVAARSQPSSAPTSPTKLETP